MHKKLLFIILNLFLTCAFIEISAITPSGNGSPNAPFEISTQDDFKWFLNLSASETENQYYILKNDIDFTQSDSSHTLIKGITEFRGDFNGNNHAISNFTLESFNSNASGLFNKVSHQANIHNLILNNPTIILNDNYNNVGSLIGIMQDNAHIENIFVDGATIKGGSAVGGIIGSSHSFGTISNCITMRSNIQAQKTYAGGICGLSHSTLLNLSSISNHIYSPQVAGGICALQHENTSARNLFTYHGSVETNQIAGGIIGAITSVLVENSFNGGTFIKGENTTSGAIIGVAHKSIISYASFDNTQEHKQAIGEKNQSLIQYNHSEKTSKCVDHQITSQWFTSNIETTINEYPHIKYELLDNTKKLSKFNIQLQLGCSPLILRKNDTNYNAIKHNVAGCGIHNAIVWRSSNQSILEFVGNYGVIKKNGVIAVSAHKGNQQMTYLLNIVAKPQIRVHIQSDDQHTITTDRFEERVHDTLYLCQGDTLYVGMIANKHSFDENLFSISAYTNQDMLHYKNIPNRLKQKQSAEYIIPDEDITIASQIIIPQHETHNIPLEVENLRFENASSLENMSQAIQINHGISYAKTFEPNKWYSICFPFEVNFVTVTESDGQEYELHTCIDPQDPNGNYYLKYLGNAPTSSTFKKSWKYAHTITKNTPYIIAFPNDYYKDKVITFYGNKQTINDVSNQFSAKKDENGIYYQFKANNSYFNQQIEQAYKLNLEGKYFIKNQLSSSIHPFSCYVYTSKNAPDQISIRALLGEKEETLINKIQNYSLNYYIHHNTLHLESSIDETIKIINMQGIVLKEIKVKKNQPYSISSLPKGLLLLQESANNHMNKIIL